MYLKHFNPYHDKLGRFSSARSVFVSGSSKTQDKNSGYYRKKLPRDVRKELDSFIKRGLQINVGDAPGIDRQVQDYLNKKGYNNVTVYGPGKQVRYSANDSWKTKPIDDPKHEPGSKEWLAKKDKAMAKDSDSGLAIILDEGAAATRKNVQRLIDQDKDVSVYELSKRGAFFDKKSDYAEKYAEKAVAKQDYLGYENLAIVSGHEYLRVQGEVYNDADHWLRKSKQNLADMLRQDVDVYNERLSKQTRKLEELGVSKPKGRQSSEYKRVMNEVSNLNAKRYDEPDPDPKKFKPGSDSHLRAVQPMDLMRTISEKSGDWYFHEPKSDRWKKVYARYGDDTPPEPELAKASLLDMGYKASKSNIEYLCKLGVIAWD